MLRSLHLKDVGPAARFDLELGERLNVLTGDNGLGKSFILDVAWWALTGTWIGRAVLPQKGKEESAVLAGEFFNPKERAAKFSRSFTRLNQSWEGFPENRAARSVEPGVEMPTWIHENVPVLYVRDAGFSVWDPTRNHRSGPALTYPFLVPGSYDFSAHELWDGLESAGKPLCNGLIRDWVAWQMEEHKEGRQPFHVLSRVLEELSHPAEKMVPGEPVRLYLDDVRRFPTIELPYGTVPVVHASAGMKRILGLAYLITWAWTEHVQASELLGWDPAERLVVLIEEPETHLHPRWQRHILPALVNVLAALSPDMKPQVLATTHSPLVLASLEPHFKPSKDKLFLFDLEDREVALREVPWVKHGDAIGWLTSDVFGLDQARSIEAERAIEAAEALMRGDVADLPEGLRTEDQVHRELLRLLPDQDRFWPRWIVRRERRAG